MILTRPIDRRRSNWGAEDGTDGSLSSRTAEMRRARDRIVPELPVRACGAAAQRMDRKSEDMASSDGGEEDRNWIPSVGGDLVGIVGAVVLGVVRRQDVESQIGSRAGPRVGGQEGNGAGVLFEGAVPVASSMETCCATSQAFLAKNDSMPSETTTRRWATWALTGSLATSAANALAEVRGGIRGREFLTRGS